MVRDKEVREKFRPNLVGRGTATPSSTSLVGVKYHGVLQLHDTDTLTCEVANLKGAQTRRNN